VSAGRRVFARPYLFELIVVANVVVLTIVAHLHSLQFLGMLPQVFASVTLPLVSCVAAGVAIRGVVAGHRGTWPRYRAMVTSAGWLTDTARMIVGEVLLTLAYGWIKLVVPVFHPRLFDEELWAIDRAICFGFSPNVFVLTLFSNSGFLRFIDWAYANIFMLTILIAFGYFLSAPSRRLRLAFMNSNVVLWFAGVYLYVLVPSLGPAYRFPDVWFEYAGQLKTTQSLQAMLMRNYTNMLATTRGIDKPVSILYGIAAFPSMHVAWQALVALWMRREWIYGEVLFAIFLFVIFIGSMITGWHYLIDSLAGIALAICTYYAVAKPMRLSRWRTLRRKLSIE
jgi:hypothetical protein